MPRSCWNAYSFDGDSWYLRLMTGEKVLVDQEDIKKLKLQYWSRHRVKDYVYVRTRVPGENGKIREVLIQRYLTDVDATLWVDHRNGDTLDNRRANLRICEPGDNKRNRRRSSASTTPFKGVTRLSRGWRATIRRKSLGGKQQTSPIFQDAREAARWYDERAREEQGEFACVNFPRPGERCALGSGG
jgi:hypothetical protein